MRGGGWVRKPGARRAGLPADQAGRPRVRQIFVYSEARAHVFLRMLAYYAEWHMRKRLAPILFGGGDPEADRAQRASPVVPAKPRPWPGEQCADNSAISIWHAEIRIRV